jgi:superfamily II DNA or RNA helicase
VLTRESPVKLRIQAPEDPTYLKLLLTYVDKSAEYELRKAKHSKWLRQKLTPEEYEDHLQGLKDKVKNCLLFEDEKGFWTYSGLEGLLTKKLRHEAVNQVQYPEEDLIPWAKPPVKIPRPYQLEMKEALLRARHGAVEVGTGLGKSLTALLLAKELALKTVIMTPSLSIASQMYEEFMTAFGTKYVGRFYDGKKESKKLFTIAVDDSLVKVDGNHPAYGDFRSVKVFIADESHLCPAKTLSRVCLGLFDQAPYRFFFSGTQLRNDGLGLLLEAITGPVVFRMSVKEGVDQGWLAKPRFKMVPVNSPVKYQSKDPQEMTRAHLYYVPDVCQKAGELANLMVEELDRQVVILIKELEQFQWVLPYLRHQAFFAHGGVTKDNKKYVPEAYWESDPQALVKDFNAGKIKVLVGTSCITTGTDLQSVGAIIFLCGGKSEIQVRQAVGRGTRKVPGKDDCWIVDFDVKNVDDVHRHALERAEIYRNIYPDFEEVSL